jgi:hypothetical protein
VIVVYDHAVAVKAHHELYSANPAVALLLIEHGVNIFRSEIVVAPKLVDSVVKNELR